MVEREDTEKNITFLENSFELNTNFDKEKAPGSFVSKGYDYYGFRLSENQIYSFDQYKKIRQSVNLNQEKAWFKYKEKLK